MFSASVGLDNRSVLQFNYPAVARDSMTHRMTLEHVLDAQQQFAQMERLGDKFFGANFEPFQAMFGSAQRSHEHDRHRSALLNMTRQLETRPVGQADIENDQIPKALVQFLQ